MNKDYMGASLLRRVGLLIDEGVVSLSALSTFLVSFGALAESTSII